MSAADDAGEQEVRAVATASGRVVAALGEDRLRLIEGALLDQWLVCGEEVLVAPADAPEICRVGQDAVDGWVSPACGGCGCVLGAELVGDGDRAETGLPTVLISRTAERVPFDVADLRVLRLDMTDLYSFVPHMEAWRAELAQYARQALEQPEAAVTPITLLGGLQLLARLEN